jgi:hypothetical protein
MTAKTDKTGNSGMNTKYLVCKAYTDEAED